ncbi:cystatin-like [Odontesthes bonariensis]|uniref:cystatin-like n=1 Tax=Odontesthes bonariensis TaxID=219752 RepID=UPI003F58D1A4
MSRLLSALICLSLVQLCVGDQLVEEVSGSGGNLEGEMVSNVMKAAQYAVKMYNTISRARKIFKLVSVIDAKSLSVYAMMIESHSPFRTRCQKHLIYDITAVLGKTNCLKNENNDLISCDLEKMRLFCHFNVWFNTMKRNNRLQSHECTPLLTEV